VKSRVAIVHQDQPLRPRGDDLSAQLGADGAAGTGDQHDASGETGADAVPIQRDRIAPEQVLDGDRPQLVDGDLAGDQVLELRHRAQRPARAFAKLHQRLHLGVGGRGHGQHDQGHVQGFHQFGDAGDGAVDGDAVDGAALATRGVVDEGDRIIGAAVIAQHVAHEHLAGTAGADDEHPLTAAQRQPMVLEPPVQQPRPGQQGQLEHQEQRRHRARQMLAAVDDEQHHDHRYRGRRGGLRDTDQVRQRREAPDAAIQPEEPIEGHANGHDHRQCAPRRVQELGRDLLQVEAGPVGQQPGRRDHEQVVQEGRGA
jgi:hypothetical protein